MRWLDGIPDSMDMSWASSRSWWWTGKPGVLQSMESQRVQHDWATDLNWICSVQAKKHRKILNSPSHMNTTKSSTTKGMIPSKKKKMSWKLNSSKDKRGRTGRDVFLPENPSLVQQPTISSQIWNISLRSEWFVPHIKYPNPWDLHRRHELP